MTRLSPCFDITRSLQRALTAVAAGTILTLAGCATSDSGPAQSPRAETGHAVTAGGALITFNTGTPSTIAARKTITGLQAGERVLGIDVRPANSKLYALGSSGRLYTLDTASGAATQVGTGTFGVALSGTEFGFDFNPTVDRIRVVSDAGQNMRLHPDTGAVVDADMNVAGIQIDGALAFAAGDPSAGKKAMVVGAAYTNGAGAKGTTNFAIDATSGSLVTQGSREGATPAVSPNTGQLFTVGKLDIAVSGAVGFDIDYKTNTAFAVIGNTLYWIDLASGKVKVLGKVGDTVRALAITS